MVYFYEDVRNLTRAGDLWDWVNLCWTCIWHSIFCRWYAHLNINPYAAGGEFGQFKMMQKTWKMTETLAHGYSSKSTFGGKKPEDRKGSAILCNWALR